MCVSFCLSVCLSVCVRACARVCVYEYMYERMYDTRTQWRARTHTHTQPGGVGAEASPQRGSRSSPGKVFLECPPWALPEYRSPANPAAESVNTSAQSPDPTQAIPAPSGRLPGKCAEARLHSNRGASMVMWTCRWLQGLVWLVLRAPSVGLWFLNVVMSHVVIIAMLSIRLAAFVLHGVLDLELPSGSFGAQAAKRGCLQTDRPGAAPAKTKACRRRLRDVSALARQLHWRLVLLADSPAMSPAAWVLLQRVTTNARTRAVLVHFNSTVSIVGIDLLLGLGACSVLMHRARLFTQSSATYALKEPKPMPYSLTPK